MMAQSGGDRIQTIMMMGQTSQFCASHAKVKLTNIGKSDGMITIAV